MRSRIYHGSVWHMRTQPRYFFRYGAFYFDLALDEIDDVARRIALFSHTRFNVLSFRDSDYLGLTAHAPACVRAPGCQSWRDSEFKQVSLLTQPRVLGYAFNPASFFLRRTEDGDVGRVLAEVHNTWGERHLYDLAPDNSGGTYASAAEKDFYVSPFIDMEGRYAFRVAERDGRLRIRIDEWRPGQNDPFFRAGMDLRALPMTNANVARMLLRYPLVTFKTIAAIHWQGLKLWLRGERFRPNPSQTRAEVEVVP
jgi:uncharacterized protein